MQVSGSFYDGKSSTQYDAILRLEGRGTLIVAYNGQQHIEQSYRVRIDQPLGNTARSIHFPDGALFRTSDHENFQQLLSLLPSRSRHESLLHYLESKRIYVLATVIFMFVFGWAFVTVGVPILSDKAAHALPAQVNLSIANGVMDILDRNIFSQTKIPQADQLRLREKFHGMVRDEPVGFNYRLLFRRSEIMGANAFALPDGTVVVTDALVALAENDEELASVLAHELGHVRLRHGLRSIIADSVLVLTITAITGDAFSATSLAAGLPIFLTESAYSREFEREADRHALNYLQTHDIPTTRFTDILSRMTESNKHKPAFNYLSSHPSTEERIEMFEQQ
jgi:Zn-dependent protease with chaperone function